MSLAARSLAVCAFALLVGCGVSLPRPPALHQTALTGAPGVDGDSLPRDVVRSGERIVIAVTDGDRVAEYTTWVDGDGRAHVAAGQDVAVGGQTLERAEQLITEALRTRDKLADVDVRREVESAPQATVLGAVETPGRVALRPGMRLSQLVAMAGGVLPPRAGAGGRVEPSPADLAGARLVRSGVAMPVDLRRALFAEPRHDVYVQGGDLLYVPFLTGGVTVFGQVRAPNAITYREGLHLSEALAAAGGVTPSADRDDIRLLRGPADAPRAYRASLEDFADGQGPDARLLPGDVVFVTDSVLEDIGEVFVLVAPLAALASGVVLSSVILLTD